MTALPARPTLAAHVHARRHVVDGEERVVLHDRAEGRLVQIGAREWTLLAAADGTRDLEGIVIAAAREGAHARVAALASFLEQLHAAGMIDDGATPAAEDRIEAAEPADGAHADTDDPRARPLDPLPGFTLTCDGSGSCCRLYATVVFGPVEAARARSLLPHVLGGGDRHERVFMPERGSGPTGGSAVTLRDGRCAYLASTGHCGIHEAGGRDAKPVGCNAFPALYADDGECVRVSVAVECACVLASVDREGGAPLVPREARVRGDLHETLVVPVVPERIEVAPGITAPRAELVAWSRRVASALPARDTAAALVALATIVAREGFAGDPRAAIASAEAPSASALRPWIAALHDRAERRAREDAAWRSERDLARRATRWIADVTSALLDASALAAIVAAPIPVPRSEDFYVRALLHGYGLAGSLPVATALYDRAVRLVVARALSHAFAQAREDELDPACAHPLALVEAMLRGHGLDAYARDAAQSPFSS